MDHTPFIWGAYGFALVILTWCALAPVLRGRKLAQRIRAAHRAQEVEHARQA